MQPRETRMVRKHHPKKEKSESEKDAVASSKSWPVLGYKRSLSLSFSSQLSFVRSISSFVQFLRSFNSFVRSLIRSFTRSFVHVVRSPRSFTSFVLIHNVRSFTCCQVD